MAKLTATDHNARLSTETLLRVSALIFLLILAVQNLATPIPKGAENSVPPFAFSALAFLGFGSAFWYNTRDISRQSLGWLPVLLLLFQSACGFTASTDLLYIVAAEIPLVLPARAASLWIIIQTLLLTTWIFWLDYAGIGNLMFLQLPQLPHILVIVLTDIGIFAMHAFAFYMGYLATSEARGRREAERLNAELLATHELLEQSSRVAERNHVAQELHDTLGHHLVALKVQLELALHLATENKAKVPLDDALSLVKKLLSDVREVVSRIRKTENIDIRKAVETLLAGIKSISIHFVFPNGLQINEPALAHVLFRCVQEAMTNTLKHANAKNIWVEFTEDQQSITLTISDDGDGCPLLQPGQGLNGMRKRLEAHKGMLKISHDVSQGFIIKAILPKSDKP
jgi:signal transduction histidine kinase